MIELIKEPEAEIAVVVGESKIIQTRRTADPDDDRQPAIADVEILADQPDGRLLNIFGKILRHHQPDALGRDQPPGLVPGPRHARHEGAGERASTRRFPAPR